MPGYEVLGFYGLWQSTDALHCRAKGIVDRYMLYIEHNPLYGIQTSHDGFEIQAMIFPYSGEDVNTAQIIYRIDGGSWQNVNMGFLGNNQYSATIPQQLTGTFIEYYIHAEDDSGRSENHPYIGSSWAHSFNCELINNPPNKPMINGTTEGVPGQEYEFTFSSIDPEDDLLFFKIEWGDGEVEDWVGPFESNEVATFNHTWIQKGDYKIRVKAKDTEDAESGWVELIVTMSRNRTINRSFQWFLQNHLNLLAILQKLLILQHFGLQ